ncbi:flagellar motor protein MotB [Nibricoccus sp. IMCC34717]|uniref:flagellar motor protein MotB n=1 Tax=Nibricoccus sp. IMCC34717 TaxID=3034021 RepID=UPI00384C3299
MHSIRILAVIAIAAAFSGCVSSNPDSRYTNPRQPGPAVGNAVGEVVGTVTGNVAGAVVGAGEGTVDGVKKSFQNERRVVRTWRTETTSDGRTIQVPVEIEVDEQGRPISEPKAK